jgi:hypothetical protein
MRKFRKNENSIGCGPRRNGAINHICHNNTGWLRRSQGVLRKDRKECRKRATGTHIRLDKRDNVRSGMRTSFRVTRYS